MNSSRTPIEAGSRFQSIREGAFGNRRISYWRVESVSRRSEGLDHATLVEEQDPTNIKTLAAAVLLDRRRFLPADVLAR